MIKIAFFDIDGTLIDFGSKEPSKRTVETLNSLQEKGVILCMATGRSYPIIPKFKGIDFDIYLTFNGSFICTKEEIIYKSPFDNNDKNIIINNLKRMNKAIAISNEKYVYTNGTEKDLEQYFSFGNVELKISDDFEKICKDDIHQIMCACRKEEYSQILNGTKNAQITTWWDKAGDIIPLSCDKGKAVKIILDYYGFSKEEAIAFGDGENDIEMLEAVGIGVAMGNASDTVKGKAKDICLTVKEDGIYHYCVENNLI